ncbi:MAG: sugar ABC transporter substrate-binding protein [Ruminiclostridium sp.]
MKKTFKTFLILLITLLMILVFAGCGGSSSSATSSDVTTTSSSSSSSGNTSVSTESGYDYTSLYAEVSKLSGEEAYNFFAGLKEKGLTDDQILQFFIGLPLSNANKAIADTYTKDGLDTYAQTYPSGAGIDNYVWKNGSGTQITGLFTKLNLKLAFTDYIPFQEKTIGDPNKTYKIGALAGGSTSPWSGNLVDSLMYQASQFSNVKLIFQEHLGDDNKFSSIMDTFIAQKVDGIMLHPRSEAVSAPAVQRALDAGIKVVTVDMLGGNPNVTSQVAGNFSANGAQSAMVVIDKLHKEGSYNSKMIMIRQPLGGTNDAIRTGHFLKVLSYFPGIEILQSYFDNNKKVDAFNNAQAALQAYPNIDIFYCGGGVQTTASLSAIKMVNRLNNGRADGKKLIIVTIDDQRESLAAVTEGAIDSVTPYTPLVGDIGMRVLAKILSGEKMPQNIVLPNIPVITSDGAPLFGMATQTVKQWEQYAYGPPLK